MQTTTETVATTSQARTIHLPDTPLQEARACLRQALAREGFAVARDVDLADLLEGRLDDTIDPYFIVEGCHPLLARQALAIARDGGLVALVRFAVWKEGTGSAIATFVPARLAAALGRPQLVELAARLDRTLSAIFQQLLAPEHDEPQRPETPAELDLDASERRVLADATRRHIDDLMREAAWTESRPMQHELSQTIDRLEAIARKLGASPPAR